MTQMLRGTPIQYEPLRVNRFSIGFPNELNIEEWLVQTSGRPKMKINPVKIDYMNTAFYVAGKYEWDPIDIKFIDPIGPSSSNKLMDWVRLHAESLTGREGYAAGYKKDLILKSLDPAGNEVQKWVLYQCMVTNIDFGDNDHGNDELQMVTITLQPDFCELAY